MNTGKTELRLTNRTGDQTDEKAISVSRVYGGSRPSFFYLADTGVRHRYTRIQHGGFGGRKDMLAECQRDREGETGGIRRDYGRQRSGSACQHRLRFLRAAGSESALWGRVVSRRHFDRQERPRPRRICWPLQCGDVLVRAG